MQPIYYTTRFGSKPENCPQRNPVCSLPEIACAGHSRHSRNYHVRHVQKRNVSESNDKLGWHRQAGPVLSYFDEFVAAWSKGPCLRCINSCHRRLPGWKSEQYLHDFFT